MSVPKLDNVIQAYHFFNPYHYEGDYCNPWSALLADYREKKNNPNAIYHQTARDAGSFSQWLINEAKCAWFEKQYDL